MLGETVLVSLIENLKFQIKFGCSFLFPQRLLSRNEQFKGRFQIIFKNKIRDNDSKLAAFVSTRDNGPEAGGLWAGPPHSCPWSHHELIPVGPWPQLGTGLARLTLASFPRLFLQQVPRKHLLCGCWARGQGEPPTHTRQHLLCTDSKQEREEKGQRGKAREIARVAREAAPTGDVRGKAQGPWGGHAGATGAACGRGGERRQRAWSPWSPWPLSHETEVVQPDSEGRRRTGHLRAGGRPGPASPGPAPPAGSQGHPGSTASRLPPQKHTF